MKDRKLLIDSYYFFTGTRISESYLTQERARMVRKLLKEGIGQTLSKVVTTLNKLAAKGDPRAKSLMSRINDSIKNGQKSMLYRYVSDAIKYMVSKGINAKTADLQKF